MVILHKCRQNLIELIAVLHTDNRAYVASLLGPGSLLREFDAEHSLNLPRENYVGLHICGYCLLFRNHSLYEGKGKG